MKFLIIGDDQSTDLTLSKIIQDYNFGEVIEYSYSKLILDKYMLDLKNIDVLITSLSVPIDNRLISEFSGKIIVVSQINDKKTIVQAYSLGAEYYITKPVNRFEVIEIIKKVVELIKFQKCIYDIGKILSVLDMKI